MIITIVINEMKGDLLLLFFCKKREEIEELIFKVEMYWFIVLQSQSPFLRSLEKQIFSRLSSDSAIINSLIFSLLHKKSPYSELFWSAFFPHFPAFGLNTERYCVSLRIQSECGKMREKCRPE